MNTGNKIALFYTAVTVGIVMLLTVVFYFMATSYMNRLYYSYLIDKAFATAEKYWEKDEVDEESYRIIQQRYEETMPAAVELTFDADLLPATTDSLAYYLTASQVAELYDGKVVRFRYRDQMGAAIYYPDNEGNFIVLILSENRYGSDIARRIGWLSLGTILLSALLLYIAGKWYAGRMVNRIDAAYHSEKNFISNASHELNNPLTAIQGECEIALMKERTPGEYQAAIMRIASETKRIIQLMKNLLFLSHGDKYIQESPVEPIMLADFMMQFLDSRTRFSPDNFGLSVMANLHLFKIAIVNLIRNAHKYSDGEMVDIRLRGNVLEIEDRGIGIPAEELEKINQPFYRASNTRSYEGQGIGLSLSIRILTTYGATVQIFSEEGKGTLVRITF